MRKVGKSPYSVCKRFTSKNISYISVGRIVTSGGMTKVKEYYKRLGKFEEALNEMIEKVIRERAREILD